MNLFGGDVMTLLAVIFLMCLVVWLARWESDLKSARYTIEMLRRANEALSVQVADLLHELWTLKEADIAYHEQETEEEPDPPEPMLPF